MDMPVVKTLTAIWRERVLAQQASGKRVRTWCRETGCHEHAFYWWRVRVGLSPVARKAPPGRGVPPVEFSRIVVRDGEPSSASVAAPGVEPIRLSLIGGRELRLPASMPVEQIARLLRAIEGTCQQVGGEA